MRFDDVASRAGLTAPTIYGGATGNRYILETTGCGAAFFDYDNDGWPDIFLVNGTTLDAGAGPSHPTACCTTIATARLPTSLSGPA